METKDFIAKLIKKLSVKDTLIKNQKQSIKLQQQKVETLEKTLRLACITLADTHPKQCIASRFDNGVNFQLCDNTGSTSTFSFAINSTAYLRESFKLIET